MNSKTFLKLVVALAILGGLAYWVNRPSGKVTYRGVSSGDLVLPGLDVNAITRIEISSGLATSVLARAEKGWVSESLFGYPARFDRIADALRSFGELKVGQVQRDGESNLAGFGLDPGGTDADYQKLVMTGADGKVLIVELGAMKQMRDASSMGMGIPTGRFMRVGDGPVILVEEMLTSVQSNPGEWVDRGLVELKSDDISLVTIVSTNDEFTIRRNEENLFDIGRIEEGATVDQSAVLRILQAFQNLNFDSVLDPALPEDQTGLANHEIISVRTKGSMDYQFKIGSASEGSSLRPVQVSVSWKPDADEGDAEKSVKEAEAAALNSRYGDWVYQLPVGLINQMLATRSGLVTKTSPAPPVPVAE